MARLNVKSVIVLVWMTLIVALVSIVKFSPVNGQAKEVSEENGKTKPESSLIDRFDEAIQQRFLTEPNFGMRRIQPVNPPNPHLENFYPINDAERTSVAGFETDGWKVSLYLFGRHAAPRTKNGQEQEIFKIDYRLNQPLPVTAKLKQKSLPRAGKLMKEIKKAFVEFQTPDSSNEDEYEFSIGKWSYVAKPVRAVNQSCLRCHADYVVTEKLSDGKYKFRKRRVGDANGVIVYGFSKKD